MVGVARHRQFWRETGKEGSTRCAAARSRVPAFVNFSLLPSPTQSWRIALEVYSLAVSAAIALKARNPLTLSFLKSVRGQITFSPHVGTKSVLLSTRNSQACCRCCHQASGLHQSSLQTCCTKSSLILLVLPQTTGTRGIPKSKGLVCTPN